MPTPASSSMASPTTAQHPAFRVAAGFCVIEGLAYLSGGIEVGRPTTWMLFGVGVVLASLLFTAAILLWKCRLVGAVVIVGAYAFRASVAYLDDGSIAGPTLLTILAMLALTLNARSLAERSEPVA